MLLTWRHHLPALPWSVGGGVEGGGGSGEMLLERW